MRRRDWAIVCVLLVSAVVSVVTGKDPAWIIGQLVMALVIVRTA